MSDREKKIAEIRRMKDPVIEREQLLERTIRIDHPFYEVIEHLRREIRIATDDINDLDIVLLLNDEFGENVSHLTVEELNNLVSSVASLEEKYEVCGKKLIDIRKHIHDYRTRLLKQHALLTRIEHIDLNVIEYLNPCTEAEE